MKTAFTAGIILSPVKKRIKGRLPPIIPMASSLITSFLVIFLSSCLLRTVLKRPISNTATTTFFRKVKTTGSDIVVTAIFARKVLVPEMTAVVKARPIAYFSFFVMR